MSIALMNVAWGMDLQPTEKLVMLALADFANDDGHCWPALQKIVSKCGVGDRQVRRIIAKFESCGLLSSKNRGRRSNYYVLTLERKPDTGDQLNKNQDRLTGHGCQAKPDMGVRSINEPPENHQKTVPAEKQPAPRLQKKNRTDHAWFTGWFCYVFQQIEGRQYGYLAKDAGQVKKLLSVLDLGDAVLRACRYFTLTDQQRFPRGSPTIGGLLCSINEVREADDDIIDRFTAAGLLPGEDQKLKTFTPWRHKQ